MDFEVKEMDNHIENFKTSYPFEKETCKKSFQNICKKGKFSHHELFLLWFPDFYFHYRTSLDSILDNKEGYLPLTWKIYLGIMAASTIRNEYLLRTLEGEFLINGGDEDWLILGLEGAPEKLKKLQILNNILAHQPWKLNEKHIKGTCNSGNSSSSWNVEDLVQSVIVLTSFHRLATVLECLKLDVRRIDEQKKDEIGNKTFASDYSEGKESSEENIKDYTSKSVDFESSLNFIINEEGIKSKIINELELMNQSTDTLTTKTRKGSVDMRFNEKKVEYFHSNDIIVDFSKYISKFCTVYLDFDNHSEEYKSYFVKNKIYISFLSSL